MESEKQPSKIIVPELREGIEESKQHLEENEAWIQESVDYLNQLVEDLEFNKEYLEHMKESNETTDFLEKMADEEGFEKKDLSKYSEEEISKIKIDIAQGEEIIKKVRNSIGDSVLHSAKVNEYIEKFKNLEKRYNELITTIKPDQVN
ncbi:MAG TPA: hypothetical protein VG621_02765 [Candidatus Paceibacterota bacterium]|nr:hypothetical protein [Candidatus Paceibacterota bacterium]